MNRFGRWWNEWKFGIGAAALLALLFLTPLLAGAGGR